MKYIASCSCGKDSLAMVYRLIEENYPLDEIVFYDTGMEFESIYNNWNTLRKYATDRNIKCVTITPQKPFLYTMFEQPHKCRKTGEIKHGYYWCGGYCRWGTSEKTRALDKYCEQEDVICYIGIAADERTRIEKERKPYKRFPLVEWNMSEADCLSFCRKRGIRWLERCTSPLEQEFNIDLYYILDRVSCWCCANKNHWELYNYWRYLPHYWKKLKELQSKIPLPFKKPYTIFDLEQRFIDGYVPIHRNKNKNGDT